MKNRIVMDSAGDIKALEDVDFVSVPLKIMTDEREFADDAAIDIPEMVGYLQSYRGRSGTACPSVGEYLEAYGDAENVYCITITSNLSGSYNAAAIAAETFRERYPQRKIHVFDSLSTGPGMILLAQRLRQWVMEEQSFEAIVEKGKAYLKKSRLAFSLECLNNLANNGRVSKAVAKITGVLGIRLTGIAYDGRLKPTGKARGEKKVCPELMKILDDQGYAGGRVLINHCLNPRTAWDMKELILKRYPKADVVIGTLGGLCSFYAEKGGLLVGFETA